MSENNSAPIEGGATRSPSTHNRPPGIHERVADALQDAYWAVRRFSVTDADEVVLAFRSRFTRDPDGDPFDMTEDWLEIVACMPREFAQLVFAIAVEAKP